MMSPLFGAGQPYDQKTHELRVYALGSSLKIKMEPITIADCQAVDSVEAAEDILLALPAVIDHEISPTEEQIPEVYAGILIQALRYANIIASCARRGSGNVVLMGHDVYQKVVDAYEAMGTTGFDPTPPRMVGRWEQKGVAVGGATVYVGDAIPADEVFVAYVGPGTAIDGPGGLLKDVDDLYLRLISNNTTALGNASDYVRRFRLVIK